MSPTPEGPSAAREALDRDAFLDEAMQHVDPEKRPMVHHILSLVLGRLVDGSTDKPARATDTPEYLQFMASFLIRVGVEVSEAAHQAELARFMGKPAPEEASLATVGRAVSERILALNKAGDVNPVYEVRVREQDVSSTDSPERKYAFIKKATQAA